MRYLVLGITLFSLVLSGCSSNSGGGSSTGGRYRHANDFGPSSPVDVSKIPDAVPRVEPKSRGGNKSPYTVLGKQYWVMNDADGYVERGGASWYGNKFHGYATSNGETYDMYQMTAAHKSLPIPTYVRVRNLNNGKQVIVRVNDRGPFHTGRIIDLSYAAAAKLGMLANGTAQVEVTAINPRTWQSTAAVRNEGVRRTNNTSVTASGSYIQVGAYSAEASASTVVHQIESRFNQKAKIVTVSSQGRTLYKVLVGPMVSSYETNSLIESLSDRGFPGAHLVNLP